MGNIFYMFLAIFAGIIVTFQAGFNTRLGLKINSGEYATLITFILGTFVVILYLIIARKPMPTIEVLKSTSWWMYLGAVSGALYVLIVVIATPKLGVGSTTLLLMFAQIATAVVIDHFDIFSLGQKSVDIYRLSGVVLVVLGVLLVNKK